MLQPSLPVGFSMDVQSSCIEVATSAALVSRMCEISNTRRLSSILFPNLQYLRFLPGLTSTTWHKGCLAVVILSIASLECFISASKYGHLGLSGLSKTGACFQSYSQNILQSFVRIPQLHPQAICKLQKLTWVLVLNKNSYISGSTPLGASSRNYPRTYSWNISEPVPLMVSATSSYLVFDHLRLNTKLCGQHPSLCKIVERAASATSPWRSRWSLFCWDNMSVSNAHHSEW